MKYLADSYFVEKQYDDCIKTYEAILKLDAELPWVYCNLGDLYCYKCEFNKALANFDKAISLDSQFAAPYYYKTRLLSIFRENDAALNCLEKVIELDPDYKEIALNDSTLNNLKLYSKFRELVGH